MTEETIELEKNIKRFYAHRILSSVFFAVPILVLFWQENGLSLTEIMLLQSIFAIATVILEVPTGYLADIKGRKKTLIFSSITGFIGISSYSFGSSFFHFLIAELFFALSISLSSGTLSAFLFDTLQDLGRGYEYKKIWGNSLFYGMIVLAAANISGAFIAEVNLRYALFASIPFFFLVIPVTLSMKEPQGHKLLIKDGYLKNLFTILRESIWKNTSLKWIMIYSGVVYAFNQSALWLYQPYFKLSGLDILHFGFIFASFQIVAGFASKYAHQLEEVLGQKKSLVMLILLVSISYILMGNFVYLFSFSFCFIQQAVRGFKKVVINDYINQLAPSNIRATVLSAESFMSRLLYAAIVPIVGWVADAYTLTEALLVLGVTSLVSGVVIFFIFHRAKVL